jgi:hypothetical protein
MRMTNGDTDKTWQVAPHTFAVGVGSFTKSLKHNQYGEVDTAQFLEFVAATRGDGHGFATVPFGPERQPGKGGAAFTNPQAGLAADRLTHHPASYSMPPAPSVNSLSTAAEMVELYWMAIMRDIPFNELDWHKDAAEAAEELNKVFDDALAHDDEVGRLRPGVDLPGHGSTFIPFTSATLFRLGLPGDHIGPLLSQFFVRPAAFGTQTIDQKQRPYAADCDFLTDFDDWLCAQNSGKDQHDQAYPDANEHGKSFYDKDGARYISTMRDLARFVNKDALHQAYFNAALILLSGKAKWTDGNPYSDIGRLKGREAGFGVLGGPHILALVSEVATRALKIVWNQKWQVHLRLRPEAYGGLAHVQSVGVNGVTRDYGLPDLLFESTAAERIKTKHGALLLPMAFTPGSPTHPAYGAGHATVAGACVTVLKAYFKTFSMTSNKTVVPTPFCSLLERLEPGDEAIRPHGKPDEIKGYVTGQTANCDWERIPLAKSVFDDLTIEGELNKLAENVAMGRSMGGVHWRTDNARSLMLGEAIAAEILADITTDVNEKPEFTFRTFGRKADGEPAIVRIAHGRIYVDDILVDTHGSSLL